MTISGLTHDHQVLTTEGWIPISEITREHLVCVLEDGEFFNYVHPEDIVKSKYSGDLYDIRSEKVDLTVAVDTMLYIKLDNENYEKIPAKDAMGKKFSFKRDAKNKLTGVPPSPEDESPFHTMMYNRLRDIVETENKLPEWVWTLNKSDCFGGFDGLFYHMTYLHWVWGDFYMWRYETENRSLVDNIQRFCVHAGVIPHITHKLHGKEFVIDIVDYEGEIQSNYEGYNLEETKVEEITNYGKIYDFFDFADLLQDEIEEFMDDIGDWNVYNIIVPSGIFMVRKNDKIVWVCS